MSNGHRIWKEIKLDKLKRAERNIQVERVNIHARAIYKNKFFNVFVVTIGARDWNLINHNGRFVSVELPETEQDREPGNPAKVFLEVSGRQVNLPFIYRQVQGSACLHAVSEGNRVYLCILGSFVPSVNFSFTFKIIVFNARVPARYKSLNWDNYSLINKIFGVEP